MEIEQGYKQMSRVMKVDAALLVFTAIWGLSFPLTKNILEYTSIFSFLSLRFLSAAIILLIVFYKKLRLITLNSILYGSIIGLVFFGSLAFQVSSLRFTSASNSAFISGLSIVFVPLLSAKLQGKKPDISSVLGVITAAIGLFFISGGLTFKFNLGDFLALMCAVCITFQIIFIDMFSSKCDPSLIGIFQVSFCAIFYTLISFFTDSRPLHINTELILSIFVTGILGTALAYTGLAFLQRFTSPTHTAIIFSAEPVFATIFAVIIPNSKGLGEVLSLNTVIGCVMILCAMLISELKICKPGADSAM